MGGTESIFVPPIRHNSIFLNFIHIENIGIVFALCIHERIRLKGGGTMVQSLLISQILQVVKKDVFPALGCTEPIAVAYASAVARKHFNGIAENILIEVSKNIYKNGKSVIIPKANEAGLDLAGALGFLSGNPNSGFMVLENIDEEAIKAAHEMISSGKVKVEYLKASPDVYVKVKVSGSDNVVEVELKDSHTHIERITVNGQVTYEAEEAMSESVSLDFLKGLTLKDLRQACETIPLEELEFIEDGIEMNKKAAEVGMNEPMGLNMGYTYLKLLRKNKLGNDASMKARILTAAACDVRMSGGNCPVMTSGGSGNQGLGVVLPIVVVAEEQGIEREKLLRAVFFGHLVNRYVKTFTGKLSGMCGCAIAAGIGASAGITWMLGGDDDQISGACTNMLANLTGMLCDGAKETCALKLSTSASEAVISAYLVNEGLVIRKNVGIIGDTVEDTIRNVGILARKGFNHIDDLMMDMI